jgi:hypothetical protein
MVDFFKLITLHSNQLNEKVLKKSTWSKLKTLGKVKKVNGPD